MKHKIKHLFIIAFPASGDEPPTMMGDSAYTTEMEAKHGIGPVAKQMVDEGISEDIEEAKDGLEVMTLLEFLEQASVT